MDGICPFRSDSQHPTVPPTETHRRGTDDFRDHGRSTLQMAALRPNELVCDIGAVADPDVGTVADLARLHLAARRLDLDVVLRNTSVALAELIEFVGLTEVLRVEPRRETEQREERLGVEEERELDDPPL
jgi:anti-anti-sigma regulatory factor